MLHPGALDPQELIRGLHPKQHGPYLVTFDADWEINLFHELANEVLDPVWAVAVESATLELNTGTAKALEDPYALVAVDCRFVVNNWPITLKARILVDCYGICGLTPVPPVAGAII